MDPIVAAAQRKRDELWQEVQKLDEFLSTYRRLQMELRLDSVNTTGTLKASTRETSPVDGAAKEAAREAEATDDAPSKRVRVRDNPKPTDVVEAAVEVIRGAGRPMGMPRPGSTGRSRPRSPVSSRACSNRRR